MGNSITTGSIVRYNTEVFFFYAFSTNGAAKLLRADGTKYSGTPSTDKLTLIKYVPSFKYNGHCYFITKQGVISNSTGNNVDLPGNCNWQSAKVRIWTSANGVDYNLNVYSEYKTAKEILRSQEDQKWLAQQPTTHTYNSATANAAQRQSANIFGIKDGNSIQ